MSERGIPEVINLRFVAVGDIVTPYANEQFMDVIEESLSEINRIKAGLERYRELIMQGYTLDEIKTNVLLSWMAGAQLNVFNMHPSRNLNISNTVYFLTSPLMEDLVKIGFTDQLPTRIKSIDRELCNAHGVWYQHRTTPVLYLKASQLKTSVSIDQLEAALHFTLSSCHCNKEWFWLDGVSNWLKSVFPSQIDVISQVLGGV